MRSNGRDIEWIVWNFRAQQRSWWGWWEFTGDWIVDWSVILM